MLHPGREGRAAAMLHPHRPAGLTEVDSRVPKAAVISDKLWGKVRCLPINNLCWTCLGSWGQEELPALVP